MTKNQKIADREKEQSDYDQFGSNASININNIQSNSLPYTR